MTIKYMVKGNSVYGVGDYKYIVARVSYRIFFWEGRGGEGGGKSLGRRGGHTVD